MHLELRCLPVFALVFASNIFLYRCSSSRRKIIHHDDYNIGDPLVNSYANDADAADKAAARLFNYTQAPESEWKLMVRQFGQISAVDIDSKGNVVIFHRGNHVWDGR